MTIQCTTIQDIAITSKTSFLPVLSYKFKQSLWTSTALSSSKKQFKANIGSKISYNFQTKIKFKSKEKFKELLYSLEQDFSLLSVSMFIYIVRKEVCFLYNVLFACQRFNVWDKKILMSISISFSPMVVTSLDRYDKEAIL